MRSVWSSSGCAGSISRPSGGDWTPHWTGSFVEDQNGQAVPIKEYMRERYGAKEKDSPKA